MHPLDEYVTPLLEFDPRKADSIVCDRWHLGELVYPHVKKRKSAMSSGVFEYVQLFLRSRGAMIAILNPPTDMLQKRLAERGDDSVNETELAQVRAGFETIAERADVWYDRYLAFPPTVDTLINSGEGARGRVTPTPFVTYVGSRAPELLLFGDERNCRGGFACAHTRPGQANGLAAHSPHGPAFMPYPATSGDFLMRSLTSTSQLTTLGIANACDVDDPLKLWRELHRPRVVALGVRAAERLTELGIDHGTMPHPQFVRRFHYRSAYSYGAKIIEVGRTGEDAISWRP